MARKSAIELVLSQMIPVDPDGSQPTYIRSARTIQTSSRLREFQTCVADEMEGQTYGSRSDVRDAFANAASSC
jgi:hypothetical protein